MVEINWTFQSLNDIENISEFISKSELKIVVNPEFLSKVLIASTLRLQ